MHKYLIFYLWRNCALLMYMSALEWISGTLNSVSTYPYMGGSVCPALFFWAISCAANSCLHLQLKPFTYRFTTPLGIKQIATCFFNVYTNQIKQCFLPHRGSHFLGLKKISLDIFIPEVDGTLLSFGIVPCK